MWGEGPAAAVAVSQRRVAAECRAWTLPSPHHHHPTPPLPPHPETSKGLCTNSHYCSLCRSLRHCRWDRGWPFQTPGLFCSTTMMGKSQPANHSSGVEDLDLSVILQYQRWSHTRTHACKKKNPCITTNGLTWGLHLTFSFQDGVRKATKKRNRRKIVPIYSMLCKNEIWSTSLRLGWLLVKSDLKLESEAACVLSQRVDLGWQTLKEAKEVKNQLFSFLRSLLTGYWYIIVKKTGKVGLDLVNWDFCCFLALCVFS